MPKPVVTVSDVVTDDVRAALSSGLNDFNDEVTGYADRRAIAVMAHDPETGSVIGGAIGRSSLGLLFLDLFYLPPGYRRSGLGTEILGVFEAEGRRRGCVAAVLYTISFQAPAFYERQGWQRFGEVACQPAGTSRLFFSKPL